MASSRNLQVFTLRPGGTPLWLPQKMAEAIGARRGARLTEAQWRDRDLVALLESRQVAGKTGIPCNAEWHQKNGYA